MDKIIIGGAERSGTSYVRSLIGADPRFLVYPWDIDIGSLEKKFQKSKICKLARRSLLADIRMSEKFRISHKSKKFHIFFAEIVKYNKFDTDFITLLQESYRSFVGSHAIIFVIKSPYSEQWVERYISDPKLYFVYVYRNRKDVFWSMYNYEGHGWRHKIYRSNLRKQRLQSLQQYRNLKFSHANVFRINYKTILENFEHIELLIFKITGINLKREKTLYGWQGTNSSFVENKKGMKIRKKDKFLRYAHYPTPGMRIVLGFWVQNLKYLVKAQMHWGIRMIKKCIHFLMV